ncbi:hypothetical protein Q5P01_012500 [Channa striata]|uniref:Uncharacterized protein n=1 Tax=Channa striata TaxID=64152 RepID=A0AA88MPX1_CHASR|nr:hypothetical protein Q5P01_012500 [Channa striata]
MRNVKLHGETKPIGESRSPEEQIGAALPANPALPDTLPRKKQHGADRGLHRLLTHTLHVQHISCSLPHSPAGLQLNKGRVGPSAPSWEGQ